MNPTEVILAFVGAFGGALLAGWLVMIADKKRILRERAVKAYADFCSQLAELAFTREEEERRCVQAKLAGTMAWIAVYANSDVIEKLAAFMTAGGRVREDGRELVDVAAAMREHVGSRGVDERVKSALGTLLVSGTNGSQTTP